MNDNWIIFEDNIVYVMQETQNYEDTFEWMKDKFATWLKCLLCFNTVVLALVGVYL